MVKKSSKHGLNTGNTIRSRHHSIARLQKYSCLVVNEQSQHAKMAPGELNFLSPLEGYDGVEISLNKRQRWQLPVYLKEKIKGDFHSSDAQITLMEHTLMSSTDTVNGSWNTCNSYYSNKGNVRESVSKKEMTVNSVKRGHIPEDHLSKKERRKLKKLKNQYAESVDEPGNDLQPNYECHVIYGAPTDGRLFKNSSRQGVTKCKDKGRNDATGCAKRLLTRPAYATEDRSLYMDEDVDGADTHENCLLQPITASLAELIAPSTNQKRQRARKGSRTSRDSQSSISSTSSSDSSMLMSKKGRVAYIDQPVTQPVSSSRSRPRKVPTPTKPYIPTYSHVLIKRSDVDTATLLSNFGDRYREAYSTPRTIILDLSDDFGPSARNSRLYLVMVFKAERKEFDEYRVYCTGSYTDKKSTKILTVHEDGAYSLAVLKSLVLDHWGAGESRRAEIAACKSSARHPMAANRRLALPVSPQWSISSSNMSELAQRIVGEQHKLMEKIHQGDRNELPSQQPLQCGICFEELSEKILYSALLSCQHYFCNECWSVHMATAVKSGHVHIACPEYECKKEVDSVLLMSMLEFSTYCLHEEHVAEYLLFGKKQAVWCPSKGCTRVLHCDSELAASSEPITAGCKCGAECCFRCLKEPHWPLTCDQLTRYHDALKKHGFSDLINSKTLPATSVNTRKCPKCQTPLEKNGGCPHMVCCKCRTAFCWKCLREFIAGEYTHRNCQPPNQLMEKVSFNYDLDPHYKLDNQLLADACKHRMYKSTSRQKEFRELCKRLIDRSKAKQQIVIQSGSRKQSLYSYLQQVTQQILATHNLLDYCCALNVFMSGPKYCLPLISRLSYSLDVLERQLHSVVCNQTTVDKIAKYYDIVKSNTQSLISHVSQALSFVHPSTSA